MAAGMNGRASIWRIENVADDYVGGASLTGTVQYRNLLVRMEGDKREMLLLQQGIETERTFTVTLQPPNLDIRERDEFEYTAPLTHPYINKRFRIMSVQYSDHAPRDPRGYMILSLVRSVRAHGNIQ